MRKILIVTDSAVLPSGMAETTRLIFSTLLRNYPGTYEVHQIGLFHCYAVIQPEWPIYPTASLNNSKEAFRFDPDDRYGEKTFPQVVELLKPDIVFAFGDPQRVFHLCSPAQTRSYRLICYVNFDGLPLPPGYAAGLKNADFIFTKSEFSREVIRAALPGYSSENLRHMYSPADTGRFFPLPPQERAVLRENLFPGWMPPDGFVLGWVGRNQWRKQVWVLYKVLHYLRTGAYLTCFRCARATLLDWNPALRQHSGALEARPGYRLDQCSYCSSSDIRRAQPLHDIFLWLHMAEEPQDEWPVLWLEEQFALQRGHDLHYTEDYGLKSALAPSDMPALFNLWDCLLFLSGGEGFGSCVRQVQQNG